MRNNKLVFMGSLVPRSNLDHGVTIKNRLLVDRLNDFFDDIITIDTIRWRKNPIVLLKVITAFIIHTKAKFILSINTTSTYKLLKTLYMLGIRRHIYYWVIGGSLAKRIKQGEYDAKYYKPLSCIIVEGNSMKQGLEAIGCNNVIWISNFKPVVKVEKQKKRNDVLRFIFLSRIMPEKGVNLILEAAKELNNIGYEANYKIDFYGGVDLPYQECFKSKLLSLANVSYKGFIDLGNTSSYNQLAQHDVMLFPTFWKGEGFPGVIIDGFIAGLPIIASDWSQNKAIIKDGITGTIIPAKDSTALVKAMLLYINNNINLKVLSNNCLKEARKYDIKNVITRETLTEIGLL